MTDTGKFAVLRQIGGLSVLWMGIYTAPTRNPATIALRLVHLLHVVVVP